MAKSTRCPLPGTCATRSGTPSTSTASVSSSGPTTHATRYVDIGIVSSNRIAVFRSPDGSRPTSGVLESATSPSSTTSVTENTAFRSGSSQQGNARRDEPDLKAVFSVTLVVDEGLVAL